MGRIIGLLFLIISIQAKSQVWILDGNGCRFFDLYEKAPNDIIIEWDGGCRDGYLTGKGTLKKYKAGDLVVVFNGELEAGKYKNYVKWTWPNGNVYEGDLRNGNMTGKGKFTWANGNVYIGDFINGERTGKGKFIWANGEVFEGDFVNSVRTGKGKMHLKNGDVYEGDFVNNKFQGWGKYTYARGDLFEGEFKNGMKNGTGRYDFSNSTTYVYHKGIYKNDKKNGPGKLFYPDGTFIEGVWLDDQISISKPNTGESSASNSSSSIAPKMSTGLGNNGTLPSRSRILPVSGYRSNSDPNNRPKSFSYADASITNKTSGINYTDSELETASMNSIIVPIFKWEFKGVWSLTDMGEYVRSAAIIRNGRPHKTAIMKYSLNSGDNTYNISLTGMERNFEFILKPDVDNQLVSLSDNHTIFGIKDIDGAFYCAMQHAVEKLYK